MALFGFLKNVFGKGEKKATDSLPESVPAALQEETKQPAEPSAAENAAAEPSSSVNPTVPEAAEPAAPEVPVKEASEIPEEPETTEPEVSETDASEEPEPPAAVEPAAPEPETPEVSKAPEAAEPEESEPEAQAAPVTPKPSAQDRPIEEPAAADPEDEGTSIGESDPLTKDSPDCSGIDIDGPLSEGEFPMELLDDEQIPPEAYDYDDDEAVYPSNAEAEVEEPEAAESFPEVMPQVFLNSYRKISDIITVLRRHADGTRILFCRDAAAAAQLRAALEERGFQSTLCTSDLPADIRRKTLEKAAAGTPSTLLIDDISDLPPVKPSCVIFCEMPSDLADYQRKQAWTACDAAYVLYQTADFVVAMQRILEDGQNSERIFQLNRARAWFVTNGSDPKELNRKLAAETPVDQAAGSCAAMTFVVTGKVYRFPSRAALKNYITEHDGILGSSVTKDTNYLITNDTESGSAKNRKAAELGTKVISEDEFINLFCDGTVPGIKQA